MLFAFQEGEIAKVRRIKQPAPGTDIDYYLEYWLKRGGQLIYLSKPLFDHVAMKEYFHTGDYFIFSEDVVKNAVPVSKRRNRKSPPSKTAIDPRYDF